VYNYSFEKSSGIYKEKASAQKFSSQTFTRINTPTFLKRIILHLPAYEDGTECSETSVYKIQTPGNYPEESIEQVSK
jgi:hypothetical protein